MDVNRLVGLAVGVALVGGLLLLAAEREPERAKTAAPQPPAMPCVGAADSAKSCAVRAARNRARRDYPLQVRDVSCTAHATEPDVFECDVDLRTTCDGYLVRYARGAVRISQPPGLYCIHLTVVPGIADVDE